MSKKCHVCNGRGDDWEDSLKDCYHCSGSGMEPIKIEGQTLIEAEDIIKQLKQEIAELKETALFNGDKYVEMSGYYKEAMKSLTLARDALESVEEAPELCGCHINNGMVCVNCRITKAIASINDVLRDNP